VANISPRTVTTQTFEFSRSIFHITWDRQTTSWAWAKTLPNDQQDLETVWAKC